MFSLICVWINDWVNNREAGDLRRYRAYYDVIVMNTAVADGLIPYVASASTAEIVCAGYKTTVFYRKRFELLFTDILLLVTHRKYKYFLHYWNRFSAKALIWWFDPETNLTERYAIITVACIHKASLSNQYMSLEKIDMYRLIYKIQTDLLSSMR